MNSEITDAEKQAMLDKMVEKGLDEADTMDEPHFLALLDALRRMYSARIMNCCDASARSDPEWRTLSIVFGRVIREFDRKESK